MDYDSVLREIGAFGRWQRRLMVLLWAPVFMVGLAFMTYSFVMGTPRGYRCRVPGCDVDGLEEYEANWTGRYIPGDGHGTVKASTSSISLIAIC